MSEQLRQFYKELDAWIKAGQPKYHDSFGYFGLCHTLYKWARKNNSPCVADDLQEEQRFMFERAGLNGDYPFNGGDAGGYNREYHADGFFNNPARRAWVEEHANDTNA
jgi:hypothetical protein